MSVAPRRAGAVTLVWLAASLLSGARADAQHYNQENLVSDGGNTPVVDGNLVNPWGLARSSASAWWSANNRTGTATLYNGVDGTPQPLIVTIPAAGAGVGSPTGAVFNPSITAFDLKPGRSARFLFVTQDGTISGWNPSLAPTSAVIKVATPGAVYTGVAIANRNGVPFLFVANFAQARIEVYDSSFARVDGGYASGRGVHTGGGSARAFVDHSLPRGFAPFNVQNIGGNLYVTYAKQDPITNVATGPGLGYVTVYDPSGTVIGRLQPGPWFNAPWGIALAPGDFGAFSHNLLVGQFRSGEIAAFDVTTGAFLGKVLKATGPLVFQEDGLWALSFGNGLSGAVNQLFFTAGVGEESHGLFGSLTANGGEQPGNVR